MQDFFKEAFFLPQYRVLGRNLKPLTVGQFYALECAESPFCGPHYSSSITLDKLAFAVHICNRSWSELVFDFTHHHKPSLRNMWWGFQNRGRDFRTELRCFYAYLEESNATPECWPAKDKGEFRAPGMLGLAWRLMGGQCTPERLEMAMDTPIRQALIWATVDACINGDGHLKTEKEIEQGIDASKLWALHGITPPGVSNG